MMGALLRRGPVGLALAFLLAGLMPPLVPPLTAQPQLDSALPTARLLTLLPNGGKAGTTTEVTFGGLDLEAPEGLLFSHPGIKAEIITPPPPKVDPKNPPKQPVPVPVPTQAKVTIASDVPPGFYDVRFIGKYGISNPRTFVVGELNEIDEKEPNSDLPQAQKVEIGSTINGNINPAVDVDYFQFTGKKGQRVLISALTSSIDSRGNPAVELYTMAGRPLASNRNYVGSDALVDAVLPADGDYYVRMYEFTHTKGTAEHFYRLSITTGPWIDAVHPCVVEPGKATSLTVYGRNLPGGQPVPGQVTECGTPLEKVTVNYTPPGDEASKGKMTTTGYIPPGLAGLPGVGYTIKNGALTSNVFHLTFASAPLVLDGATKRSEDTAQELPVPCEVAGQLLEKGERDWYAFNLKKGEAVNIEILSERLTSPTYMSFTLRKAGAKNMLYESQDNNEIVANRFYARTEDPAPYRFTAPEDGKYLIKVQNRLGDTVAGPRRFYRLRLTNGQPDFQLVVQPAANARPEGVTLAPGARELIAVMALRRDGFTDEIQLEAQGLPPGVVCAKSILPAEMNATYLVLQAPAGAGAAMTNITIKGTANINGKAVVREGIPATMVWPLPQAQNLSPAIARVARAFPVAVREGKPAWDLTGKLDKTTLVQGDKGTLTVKVNRLWPDLKQPIQVQTLVADLPKGLTFNNNQPITIAPDKSEMPMPVVVGNATQPGIYLVPLRSSAQVPYNKDPMAKQKPNTNIFVPGPMLTVEILPKSLAKVTVSPTNLNVKKGMQGEIAVKVERQFSFNGEFKTEVVLPPNTAGLQFDSLVIPAGMNEGKLIVKVPADAKEGARGNLILRTTALYGAGKVPTVQDSPAFTISVTK